MQYPPMRSQLSPSQSSSGGVDNRTRNRLCWANFLFGTLNNIIYVVILSAALDLVDRASTPKGIILLVNITPALLVKIAWPYFVPGPPRYGKRVAWCSGISFAGIIIVATSATLLPRLFGIALASFSSGLGEMTFLQKATLYGSLSPPGGEDYGGTAVGWFSSGTGAAGIGGAGLWWVVRGLGVRRGLLICSVLPLAMSGTYFLLLPPLTAFRSHSPFAVASSSQPYSALPADSFPNSEGEEEEELDEQYLEESVEKGLPALTTAEKIELARPLVRRYMVPLFLVYLAEYTINSGVAPTLLYQVPTKEDAPVLALVIKSLRDYYPLWQLLYQTFVFVSRSSISILHLPPLPLRLLPLPTALQLVILLLTTLEASTSFLVALFGEHGATWITAALICCEGLCGGAAYVNAFHRLATEEGQDEAGEEAEEAGFLSKDRLRIEQEKEFRISAVGFADTGGILAASLVSSFVEPRLCASQVARGRLYCRQLD